jgi:peptidyl-prolyl cis-trans isomerase C
VPVAPKASAADEAKARERVTQIQNQHIKPGKMSFSEVAQRFSEGPSAPMGGDQDYQTRDKLDPDYYAAAVKLSVGQVSPIVRSQFGFHIIKLTAVRSWEEVDKGYIKQLVVEQKRQEAFEEMVTGLRKKAKVVVNTALLKD